MRRLKLLKIRKRWLCLALLIIGLAAWAWVCLRPVPQALAPGEWVTQASQGLDEIAIQAVFRPEDQALCASQTLRVQNREGEVLDSLVLRTYANAFQRQETSPAATEELFDTCYGEGFSPGGITIEALSVEGAAMPVTYLDEAETVLFIPLRGGWQPGEWLEVSLRYTVDIPNCRHRFGYSRGIWALGNVFPHVAAYEGGAWRQDAYISIGDPFISACANYRLTLTLPQGYTPAATGYAKSHGGVYTYETPAVRDFCLVILKGGYTAAQQEGETLVISVGESRGKARESLKYLVQALRCFNAAYGPYPYASLTAAAVDFPFGGMEYPGLVMLGKELCDAGGQSLEWTAAHETAHQWWYGVVGSDQYYEPWQDEALCEYALLDYVETYYGIAARESMAYQRIETAMRVTIPRGVTPGSPIDYFGDLSEYTLVTYRRGAALMVALENTLGKGGFRDFLQTYYRQNAFKRVDRQAFLDTLREVSGSDWSALVEDYLDTYLVN